VIQQGQVFKLQATCADSEPLWAYRYSYQHAVSLLDALALERAGGRWVDVGPQVRSRAVTRFPGLAEGVHAGSWTLGGRRGQKP